jgi:hypothetical protein
MKATNFEQLSSRMIEANLYQYLKVPKAVFEKSMHVYMMEPAKRTIIEEEIQAIKEKHRKRERRELTREQCLEATRKLEQYKLEAQKKMYYLVRTQKLAPQMINALIKVEKLKSDDRFFNETGMEEEDVEPSIKKLNLEEDPEFKAIVGEFEA